MLVEVIYCDDSRDMVDAVSISSLIREERILAFKRTSGWVYIGKDRIRKADHIGKERAVIKSSYESDLPGVREAYM